jgi:UDPglucose 6-dehydrogenase
VGTSHRVAELIRARTNAPFHIANNPEFLKEGAAINDFMKPDRVVCGVEDEAAGVKIRELYESFVRQGNPIYVMDVRSSEMVKYASNAMLACKISFINEIANLCEHYGADIRRVRSGMCADRRIGNQFLHPGLGYGGSCFPKDTLAVVGMGKAVGFDCKLNEAVHNVNQDQRSYFWNKILDHFGPNLKGKTFAIWGIAFKPETDDIREAPSIALIERALAAGASVRAFDSVAAENLNAEHPEVTTAADMYEALDGADALIICTEWSEFRQPDFDQIAARLKSHVVFDGRNIYRREQMKRMGFTYYSVGRPPVEHGSPERVESRK